MVFTGPYCFGGPEWPVSSSAQLAEEFRHKIRVLWHLGDEMTRRGSQHTSLARSKGDPEAFSEFYRSHAEALLAYFTRRTFEVEIARDLMAETFAQAFEHRGRFRGDSDEKAAGWLYAIARHQFSRYARRGIAERKAVDRLGIQVPEMDDDDYARIVELAGLDELRSRIVTAFSTLAADQQRALQLRVVEERPYPDVAHALAISEQTARARVSRGLQAVADILDNPTLEEALA